MIVCFKLMGSICLWMLMIANASAQQACFKKVFITNENQWRYQGEEIFSLEGKKVNSSRLTAGIYLLKTNCVTPNQPIEKSEIANDTIAIFPFVPNLSGYNPIRWKFPSNDSRSGACASGQQVYDFIDSISVSFTANYGTIAHDSILAVHDEFNRLEDSGLFVIQAEQGVFEADTTPYITWLTNTLRGARTTADSIENICQWIAGNYPYGDYDTLVQQLSPDSIYQRVISGIMFGQCGDYSVFLGKIALRYPSWGTPIIITSRPDSLLSGGASQPSHVFLGFVNHVNNAVWCVADPTLGGVVRDNATNAVLPLPAIRKYLLSSGLAERIKVKEVESSVQNGWDLCMPSILFKDTQTLTVFTLPSGENLIRGHWYSFADPNNSATKISTPYWTKCRFPRMTFYNVYVPVVSKVPAIPVIRQNR